MTQCKDQPQLACIIDFDLETHRSDHILFSSISLFPTRIFDKLYFKGMLVQQNIARPLTIQTNHVLLGRYSIRSCLWCFTYSIQTTRYFQHFHSKWRIIISGRLRRLKFMCFELWKMVNWIMIFYIIVSFLYELPCKPSTFSNKKLGCSLHTFIYRIYNYNEIRWKYDGYSNITEKIVKVWNKRYHLSETICRTVLRL